jgi:hypothetical protein
MGGRRAELAVLDRVGHIPHVEALDAVTTRRVSFLDSLRALRAP